MPYLILFESKIVVVFVVVFVRLLFCTRWKVFSVLCCVFFDTYFITGITICCEM